MGNPTNIRENRLGRVYSGKSPGGGTLEQSAGNILIKDRVSSMTEAGASIVIDANWAYSEGEELRYSVTSFAGTGASVTGEYFRVQNDVAASGKSITGKEVYAVTNNFTIDGITGQRTYAYIKGASAKTVATVYATHGELSWDAGAANTTISTEAAVSLLKITGGACADYTKIHGQIIRAGDMDGQSRTYGNAFTIEDDASMAGTITWTVGLNITTSCVKGIHLGSSGGAASASGILIGIGTTADPALTSTADGKFVEIRAKTTAATGDNRLAYLRYDIGGASGGECLRALTDLTAATSTARGTQISLQVGSAGYISGLGVGVDAQLYIKDSALPAGGTYAAQNVEIYSEGASSSVAAATEVAFFRAVNSGNATGMGTVDDKAFIFDFTGFTSGVAKAWYDHAGNAPAQIEEWLKVKTPAGTRWLPLYNAVV